MFKVTRVDDDRLDFEMSGKLDELVNKSAGNRTWQDAV